MSPSYSACTRGVISPGRGGERELRFVWSDFPRVLPVWLPEGRLVPAAWGNRRDDSRTLPVTRWASLPSWEQDRWARYNPTLVTIPATLVADGRPELPVWVSVRQGLRALLARDEVGRPRVFPLCEPSSYYFRIMTRSVWMPVFIGERF